MTVEFSFNGGPDEDGPLVSVIIPTYKDSEYIRGALDSVSDQTYRPIEIVIVDSSDVGALRDLASNQEGVTYVSQKPSGPGAARNAGIDTASGDVITFLDADDRWEPEKLTAQVDEIERGAGFVYTDAYVEGEDDSKQYFSSLSIEDPSTHHVRFFRHGGIPCLTVAIARECLDGERFDESLSLGEDRHMWIRLLANSRCRPAHIDRPLARYRRREGSLTSNIDELYENDLRIIDDVVDRFPELEPHRESMIARAEYKRGKHYLRLNRRLAAREAFKEAIQSGMDDGRVYPLLLLTYIPWNSKPSFELLERTEMTVRRLSSRIG